MPGPTPQPATPGLTEATCRYRWSRTIATSSPEVCFVPSYNRNEQIKLTWSETSECFYSPELQVPVGDYGGSVLVEGQSYPVENISIKHYTFEVDLYVKEDLIEDEVGVNETLVAEKNLELQLKSSGDIDTYQDINTNLASYQSKMDSEAAIHMSAKYEDLVRQQMSYTTVPVGDNAQEETIKSDHGSGRHTPLGDVAVERFVDGDSTYVTALESDHSVHSSARHTPQMDNINSSVVDDDVEQRTYVQSLHSAYHGGAKQSPLSDTVEDFFATEARRSPVRSDHSAHSSARQTPQAEIYGSEGRRTPQRSGEPSLQGSTRHTPLSDIGNLGEGDFHRSPVGSAEHSVHSSARQTPQYDIMETNLERTPVRSAEHSVHSSARNTPQVELVDDVLGMGDRQPTPVRSEHSTYSSARQTPQKDLITDTFRTSQEKLYGSQEMRRLSGSDREGVGSYHGSGDGSKAASLHGSRPQSVTSEQELSQYLEGPRQGTDQGSERSDSRRTPVMGGTNQPLPPLQGYPASDARSGSASSLPVLSTQPRMQAERRSHTPDNHIRVPGSSSPMLRGPLVTGRGVPLSGASSRASSRTMTPVATNGVTENGYREDVQRIQELEDNVTNLRKLLSNRETEVHDLTNQIRDLRDINRSLREEMEHVRARTSPGLGLRENSELEKKYNQLLSEKEILAGEVVKLQEELENVRGDGGQEDRPPSLSSYNPNNPYVLQRKIADLQSQVQDMQEANESHVAELANAEKKIQEISQENKSLLTVRDGNMKDLEDENKRLHEQISRLRDQGTTVYSDSDLRTRVESQQLREDNRALRERNYVLHDDNIKLKEELAEMRRVLEHSTSAKTSTYQDDKPRLRTLETGNRDRLLDKGGYLSDTGYPSDKPYRTDSLYRTDTTYHRTDRLGHESRTSLEKTLPDRTSLERDSLRQGLTRTNYDSQSRYDRSPNDSQSRYDRAPKLESSVLNRSLDRSFDRSRYDRIDHDHTHSDSLRTGPDGSAGDKSAQLNSSLTRSGQLNSSLTRYESLTSPERASHSKTGIERSRTERLGLDHDLTSDYGADIGRHGLERDFKSLTSSYPASSYPELSRVAHISRSDKSRARTLSANPIPKTVLKDDPSSRRPVSALSDLSDSTAALISGYSRNSPKTSPQRPKQDYYSRDSDKAFESLRKMPSAPAYTSEDTGDMSDTATDILVNAQPLDKVKSRSTRTGYRPRTNSAGSDASISSFSDVDEELSASMRRRSKSADGRVLRRSPTGSPARSNPTTPVKGNPGGDRSLTPGAAGYRTMTPRPIATQHNKPLHSASSTLSLTQGMRPFAPRTPADVNMEDVVKFSRLGGKLSQGTVKFIGHLPGRSDVYLGVELDKEEGKHDGNFEGARYFRCKPNKGVFVAFNKVIMAWAPY